MQRDVLLARAADLPMADVTETSRRRHGDVTETSRGGRDGNAACRDAYRGRAGARTAIALGDDVPVLSAAVARALSACSG